MVIDKRLELDFSSPQAFQESFDELEGKRAEHAVEVQRLDAILKPYIRDRRKTAPKLPDGFENIVEGVRDRLVDGKRVTVEEFYGILTDIQGRYVSQGKGDKIRKALKRAKLTDETAHTGGGKAVYISLKVESVSADDALAGKAGASGTQIKQNKNNAPVAAK
jgi:hypothetical protein